MPGSRMTRWLRPMSRKSCRRKSSGGLDVLRSSMTNSLARRADRDHDRRVRDQEAADDPSGSDEQDAAIARARESWLLSQVRRDEGSPDGSD